MGNIVIFLELIYEINGIFLIMLIKILNENPIAHEFDNFTISLRKDHKKSVLTSGCQSMSAV